MAIETLYPPTPANVPVEITRVDAAYRTRVIAMIGGLFLFLLLYLILIALAGLLAYGLLIMPIPELRGRGVLIFLVLKFGGALAAVLLWLFLFKGLFKGQRVERSQYLTLQKGDHPELFEFIERVYRDVGAPRPRNVYVSPDVNAALVYDTSLLNLFLPPRKDLLIGLGLINVVTLSEFKAVLAHEFGHFAQKSVGLGSYLYVANRAMSDVIYSRDGLDRFLDQWSSIDVRVSFPAWGLKGVLWGVRKILGGVYQGLNLLHLSLSRQMEFNADNVAVSLTGSDALVHGLARLEFASECLADAAQSLSAAADHGLFTDDLFYHQTQAALRLRRKPSQEKAGLPPELPANPTEQVRVFEQVDDGIPDKYRSHPTDWMREQNAKRIYVRSPHDERSPWLLFRDLPRLKQQATANFYLHGLERKETYEPQPAAKVQEFIDAEHAETTYDAKYHGLYDDRFIHPGDLDDLPTPLKRAEVEAWLSQWPGDGLGPQLEQYRQRQGEHQLLRGLQSGELALKGKTFRLREQEYTAKDVDRLFKQVDQELDAEIDRLRELDRQVFLAYRSLAHHLHQGEAELLDRYRFHMKLQGLLIKLIGEETRLQAILNVLSTHQQLSEADFAELRKALDEIQQALQGTLEEARTISMPALTNVPPGSTLHGLIVDRSQSTPEPLPSDNISGQWLVNLLTHLGGVTSRLKRLHFKSLGSLLAFQERLTEQWRTQNLSAADCRDRPTASKGAAGESKSDFR